MDLDIQKQIWNKFIDAQEQIIKLRSLPVSIIPEKTRIAGDKIFLTVNQNQKKEIFADSLTQLFKLNKTKFSLNNGSFIQDTEVTSSIKDYDKQRLSELAAKSYIKFNPNPVIDGVIEKKKAPFELLRRFLTKSNFDYSIDKSGIIQIGVADLKRVERKLKQVEDLNINIPDTAGIILKIKPSIQATNATKKKEEDLCLLLFE